MINASLVNGALVNGTAAVVYATIAAEPVAVERFICTLYDSGGSNPITLPIKSFQGTRKIGVSWLAVDVPGIADYAAAIDAREDGVLEITRKLIDAVTGAELDSQVIHSVKLETVRSDLGPVNDTGILEGSATVAASTPRIVSHTGATYRQSINGRRHYRMPPNSSLRPGDGLYVTDTDETFEVGDITYYVGVDQRYMYVTETATPTLVF